ncbi:hypothetical protein NL676_007595 [Syzygium grande]|nr:hypothetical protein NL676_007595 [Syzygium grande]
MSRLPCQGHGGHNLPPLCRGLASTDAAKASPPRLSLTRGGSALSGCNPLRHHPVSSDIGSGVSLWPDRLGRLGSSIASPSPTVAHGVEKGRLSNAGGGLWNSQ